MKTFTSRLRLEARIMIISYMHSIHYEVAIFHVNRSFMLVLLPFLNV